MPFLSPNQQYQTTEGKLIMFIQQRYRYCPHHLHCKKCSSKHAVTGQVLLCCRNSITLPIAGNICRSKKLKLFSRFLCVKYAFTNIEQRIGDNAHMPPVLLTKNYRPIKRKAKGCKQFISRCLHLITITKKCFSLAVFA